MTPKEKAIKLVDRYRVMFYGKFSIPAKNKAKKCALIAVDEIIDLYKSNWNIKNGYWQEVKKEIEKL
jgi:hypothetical protein